MTRERLIEAALHKVIGATQSYLPPDGISEDELINRVLEATDNSVICAALATPPTSEWNEAIEACMDVCNELSKSDFSQAIWVIYKDIRALKRKEQP